MTMQYGNYNEGAIKAASKRIGVPVEVYKNKMAQGLKWCCRCKQWKIRENDFSNNTNKGDGLHNNCRDCAKKQHKDRRERKKEVQNK